MLKVYVVWLVFFCEFGLNILIWEISLRPFWFINSIPEVNDLLTLQTRLFHAYLNELHIFWKLKNINIKSLIWKNGQYLVFKSVTG